MPWKYGTYPEAAGCANPDKVDTGYWCPTGLTSDGAYIEKQWGTCNMEIESCIPDGRICFFFGVDDQIWAWCDLHLYFLILTFQVNVLPMLEQNQTCHVLKDPGNTKVWNIQAVQILVIIERQDCGVQLR